MATGIVEIPIRMTSNSAPSPFKASSKTTHYYGGLQEQYAPYKAFVGNIDERWISMNNNVNGDEWLQIDLGYPRKVRSISALTMNGVQIRTYLEWSNDGLTFTRFAQTLAPSQNRTNSSVTIPSGEYRYLRFIPEAIKDQYSTFSNIKIYEEIVLETITIDKITLSEDRFSIKDVKLSADVARSYDSPFSFQVSVNGKVVVPYGTASLNPIRDVLISKSNMQIGTNTLTVEAKIANTTITATRSTTFVADPELYVGKLKQLFGFKFLQSPLNPKTDTSIGQAYGLSYLNSQPGGSFMFRFKPYGTGTARGDRDEKLGTLYQRSGSTIPDIRRADRSRSKEGLVRELLVGAIRPYPEALLSRHFFGNLITGTAIVSRQLRASMNPEEGLVVSDEIAGSEESLSSAHEMALPIGHRLYEDSGMVIAEELMSIVRRFNNPEAWVEPILMSTRKAFDAGLINTHLTGEKENESGLKLTTLLSSGEREEGLFFDSLRLSERTTVMDGLIEGVVRIGDTPIKEALMSGLVSNAEVPNKEGLITGVQLAQDETREGIVLESTILSSGQEMKPSIIPDRMSLLAEGNKGAKARIDQRQWFVYKRPGGQAMHEGSQRFITLNEDEARKIVNHIHADGNIQKRALRDKMRIRFSGYNGKDARFVERYRLFDGDIGKDGLVVTRQLYTTYKGKTAIALTEAIVLSDVLAKTALVQYEQNSFADKLMKKAMLGDEVWIAEISTITRNAKVNEEIVFLDRPRQDGQVVKEVFALTENESRRAWVSIAEVKVNPVMMNAWIHREMEKRINLVRQSAIVLQAVRLADNKWKDAFLKEHLPKADKRLRESGILTNVMADRFTQKTEQVREAIIEDWHKVEKAEKDSYARPLSDEVPLAELYDRDAIFTAMIIADRTPDVGLLEEFIFSDRRPIANDAITQPNELIANDTVKREGSVTTERLGNRDLDKLHGLLSTMAIGHKVEEQRPAYIPTEQFILAGDGSSWEDIWTQYSPGIDILDVPDGDFDYSTLASRVYDPETGVPLNPVGPTNKAEVKVKVPLHHPVPSNADVGLGSIPVDNYIFMDTILAVESVKNRNKLRYAGMPAEKAIRELLSNLHAWINQAAPGNEEYQRAFRFVRWYSERAVTSLSAHLLMREYKPWRSQIHNNGDLGISYKNNQWPYLANAMMLQTEGTSASIEFEQTNYIDGEITLRGYFDNPRQEGTMDVKVDGVSIGGLTKTDSGVFTLVLPVSAGHHKYDFVFDGLSGRVSLSSLEISGSIFVGATTTTDDTNVNGLKASTLLMEMLLLYFEKHHGGGKSKGAMAIKQRGVWNQT